MVDATAKHRGDPHQRFSFDGGKERQATATRPRLSCPFRSCFRISCCSRSSGKTSSSDVVPEAKEKRRAGYGRPSAAANHLFARDEKTLQIVVQKVQKDGR